MGLIRAVLAALLTAHTYATTFEHVKNLVVESAVFKNNVNMALPIMCKGTQNFNACKGFVSDALFCLELKQKSHAISSVSGSDSAQEHCQSINSNMPDLSLLTKILAVPAAHKEQIAFLQQMARVQTWARSQKVAAVPKMHRHRTAFLQQSSSNVHKVSRQAPEDELAKEMTHDLEMNFNKIAPFGKEDTAKELQDHAAKTQDTLVDAVENAEVAEIKRAVFRALTRLRAATIKEFDTIARLETQAIDAYNDAHHYRAENPLAHLHEDEAPVETDKLKSFH
jgi:hypothetical protein